MRAIAENPPTESSHASTIVKCPNGDLLAAWFGGKKEGERDCAIYMSRFQEGAKWWDKPKRIAHHDWFPCWNPVLYYYNAKLWLNYKVGSSPQTWCSVLMWSFDCGYSFEGPALLPAGSFGPVRGKPIIVGDSLICGSSTENHFRWDAYVETSTWMKSEQHRKLIPCDESLIQPAVWYDGKILRSFLRPRKEVHLFYAEAKTKGHEAIDWRPAIPTKLPNPNSAIDVVKSKEGIAILVYNHSEITRESLALSFSLDANNEWSEPWVIDKYKYSSYPAIICDEEDNLHITWTKNRRTIVYEKISVNQWKDKAFSFAPVDIRSGNDARPGLP